MGLLRILTQNKSPIFLTLLLIYILFWAIIETYKQLTKSNEILVDYQTSNFHCILAYLSNLNINLLLIDPFLLDHLFIRQLSFEQFSKRLITFGISNNSIPLIYALFSLKNLSIKTSVDHIFIEYDQKIIHLAILHNEKTYFLIQKNSIQLPIDVELSYGDIPRAIEHFEIIDKYSFSSPRNVSHFLWLYQTSEFLSCNKMLAHRMETKYHLYQNRTQFNLTFPPMRNVIDRFNKLEKRYWLAGGTLLGWYRHCGLIPYTEDVDIGLFAEEYDESIRDYFLGNPVIYLWGALGLVNDSLEFRLFTGQFTFDLFWAYQEDNYRWCGYQIQRRKYRRILPLLPKLCSCDLFGYLFTIPCSPIDYLNNEYGNDTWRSPLQKNYTWVNIKYHSVWNDLSWMYAVRLYTSDGKLRTDKDAVDWIGKDLNYSFKTIPSFRNILPKEFSNTSAT